MSRRKKCHYCGSWFHPRINIGKRQKACVDPGCLWKRKREADRRWHWRNRALHLEMIRDWFEAHPGYLKHYRQTHPDYRRQNIQKTLWRRLQTLFDKKTHKLLSPCGIRGTSKVRLLDNKTHSPFDGGP